MKLRRPVDAQAEPVAGLPSPQPERDRRMILVVDDESELRDLLRVALVDEGYDVVTAGNGEAALRLAARHRPALILLDLWMPVMDGKSFVEAYRREPEPRAPILLMSAGDTLRTEAADLAGQGVRGYLAKPFDIDDLIALADLHSGRHRGADGVYRGR